MTRLCSWPAELRRAVLRPAFSHGHEVLFTPATLHASSVFNLEQGEIQVWFAVLDSWTHSPEDCWKVLSPDEQDRARRYVLDRDRARFIRRRCLLRRLLSCCTRMPPDSIQFRYSPTGQPALAGSSLRFSVSHSQGALLMAFSPSFQLGVDLEKRRAIPEMMEIAKSHFSPGEWTVFRSLPDASKVGAFYQAWTRKEAYLKATGEGLGRALDSFEVTLAPGEKARVLSIEGNPERASCWELYQLSPGDGFIGALAVCSPDV